MPSADEKTPPRDTAACRRILAYVERIVSGTEKPNAERLSLDAFEFILFGLCLKESDSETLPTQRRRPSR